MGIFNKFKIGFKKSASALTTGIKEIIIKKEIDDENLNKIEEFLIQSDVGVEAASEIKEIISTKKIGPNIENHKIFPERSNVTIAQIINKNLIKVKVWERGAGLTKACGTAACATVFASKSNNLTDNKTDIEFENGKLTILIDEKDSIHMKGPVSDIKEIKIKL